MSYIRGIEDNQNLIKKRTIENHEKEISLCNEGISLLADAYTLLDGTDFLITKEHAVRLLIWGYLGAVQSTFLWCFSAACTGQYRISIVILRVLIEEIITSHYFIKYPEKAFETIDRASKNANISRVRFEPDIYKKFNAVGIKQNDSLYKFYQEISEPRILRQLIKKHKKTTFSPENSRVSSSLVFTQWVKEKAIGSANFHSLIRC